MALRHSTAVSIAPIFLRVGLGVTFLWAGLGKLLSNDFEVKGENAAILANMGVNLGPGTPPQPAKVEPPAPAKDATPTAPAEKPETKPDAKPDSKPADPTAPADKTSAKPAEKAKDSTKKGGRLPPLLAFAGQAQGGGTTTYTGADFPEPRNVSRVHAITLMVYDAAHPATDSAGATRMRLAPGWAGEGAWPIRLGWAATITETLGGTLLLVGLFTRLGALGIASTMAVAIWLTVVGPALQSGNTTLGFLPGGHARFDVQFWMMPLWQLSLLTSALALLFAGPGSASLDSVIFSDAPEPVAKPKAKPAE